MTSCCLLHSERLRINPVEHPIMLAEPSHNTIENREKLCQLMFEQYQPPALFLAKNAVLSSFATGRQTSLVVDCGHEGTTGKPTPTWQAQARTRISCRPQRKVLFKTWLPS